MNSTWIIDVNKNGVRFTRIHEGKAIENYGEVTLAKAAVYAAAIIQGFQPPRSLLNCDKHEG